MREQTAHRDDVSDLRNVFQFDALAGQQRRGHRGQGGILCAADAYGSFERPSTFNQESIHVVSVELSSQFVFVERERRGRCRLPRATGVALHAR